MKKALILCGFGGVGGAAMGLSLTLTMVIFLPISMALILAEMRQDKKDEEDREFALKMARLNAGLPEAEEIKE